MQQQTLNETKTKSSDSKLKSEFDKIKEKKIKEYANMPFVSKLTGVTIEERNEQFEKLSKCDRAKEIAFDALKLLMTNKKISAHMSGYWSFSLDEKLDDFKLANHWSLTPKEPPTKIDLQKKFVEPIPQCSVCQRGLWMLSQIRVAGFNLPNLNGNTITFLRKGLPGIVEGVTFKQLEDMETMYEGTDEYQQHFGRTRPADNSPYEPHTNKMLANVMCNIIQNCKYKKNDFTDYLKLWNVKLKNPNA